MADPPQIPADDTPTLAYQSPGEVDALARPAGAALLIWASLLFTVCVVITGGLVALVWNQLLGQYRERHFAGVVELLFMLVFVLLLCVWFFYHSISGIKTAMSLLRGRPLPLGGAIENLNVFTAFLCIVGGIAVLIVLGHPDRISITIGGSIAVASIVFAAGLAYTRRLLIRLHRKTEPEA